MRRFPARTTLKTAVGVALAGSVTATLAAIAPHGTDIVNDKVSLQASSNPVTPGNFNGYGFDQCNAPSQTAMDRWMERSPYIGVGIYISGYSRGCREQPNLTPGWVRHQLANGWKLLPITLGPQASCSSRFPRYGNDKTINSTAGKDGRYWPARKMGRDEAVKTVNQAKRLGLPRSSVMYYDLEAFDAGNTRCRNSALYFLSSWTATMHRLGYKSGVYSSAASGIRSLDNARVNQPGKWHMPDQIWIADWDGKRSTQSRYVRSSGWTHHQRIKQYKGGHNETYAGVTINMDRNWLDVGRGRVNRPVYHCRNGKKYVKLSFMDYNYIGPKSASHPALVKAAKCLLKERYSFSGDMNGVWGSGMTAAVNRFRKAHGWTGGAIGQREWIALLSQPRTNTLKYGMAGEKVRNLQRTMNAAFPSLDLGMRGIYNSQTRSAVKRYQKSVGIVQSGNAAQNVWRLMRLGKH